ncbi:MAG: hypothetical protein H0V25_02070 [Solirubrobacterales bacterium]|nr:hypothetical protein [Solirubrobacterales bacterium]
MPPEPEPPVEGSGIVGVIDVAVGVVGGGATVAVAVVVGAVAVDAVVVEEVDVVEVEGAVVVVVGTVVDTELVESSSLLPPARAITAMINPITSAATRPIPTFWPVVSPP